jgi:hypothetical protein
MSNLVINWVHLGSNTIGKNERLPVSLLRTSSPLPSPPQVCGGEGEDACAGSGAQGT